MTQEHQRYVDHVDVESRGLQNADVLAYNAALNRWEPTTVSSSPDMTGTPTAGNLTSWADGDTVQDSGIATSNVPLLNAANTFTSTGDTSFAGNVGIGTDSPTEKLHVYGNVVIGKGNSYPHTLYMADTIVGSKYSVFEATDATTITINKGGWPTVSINGNVGIGTTSPSAQLHVKSSGNTGIIIDAGTANEASLKWFKNGVQEWELYSPVSSGDLRLWETGGSDRLTIQGISGNVGIGTTAPTEKLQVYGDIAIGDGSSYPHILHMAGSAPGSKYSVFEATNSSLITINKGGWTNVLIKGKTLLDGKVGMGTHSPAAQLEVVAGDTTTVGAIFNNPTSTTVDIADFQIAGASKIKIDSAGRLVFASIPISNPGGSGIVWSNGGVLNIT